MAGQYVKYPLAGGGGSGTWKAGVANAGALPLVGNTVGDARVAEDTGIIYVWDGASWVPQGGGLPAGTANTFAGYDSGGTLFSVPGFNIDTNSGGMNENITLQPNNAGGFGLNGLTLGLDPLQNSPTDSYQVQNISVNFDVNSSGFSQGTSGTAATLLNMTATHQGTGNIGAIALINTYQNIGNGTDPISVNGFFIHSGFADINSGVTMVSSLQGYNFQPNVHAGAILQQQVLPFADFATITDEAQSYQSFSASPNIGSIANNANYTGLNINPSITDFTGNAGFGGVGIFGILGDFDTGGFQGLTVSPSIGTINNGFFGVNMAPSITNNTGSAIGINVSMNSVTNYAGLVSSLVIQDITYTFLQPGDNNSYTIEYADDATAGSESFTILGNAVTCHMESGVSTATQIAAAAALNLSFSSSVSTVITGVGSNTQVSAPAANFVGGVNPGTKKAAQFDGDVSINGALSFTGALSVGQLNSFANYTVVSGAGVASVDTLITAPNVPASATITGTDLLAINTAMLLTIGASATVTSSFLGFAALGLPAVLSMGAGSTIDLVEGAVFAISLDGAAGGGTVDEVDLCRSLAIPNGITTVNRLVGYKFDLPFGDPGTTTWGIYLEPVCHNFIAGDLKVGGTDTVTNSSVAVEIESTTKAFVLSRMTTAQKNALTAIAGMVVFDTDLAKMCYYDGSVWVAV